MTNSGDEDSRNVYKILLLSMRKIIDFCCRKSLVHLLKMYILIIAGRIFVLSFAGCSVFIPKREISFFLPFINPGKPYC